MSSISDYKTRVAGKSIKQSIADNTKQFLLKNFVNSPSYFEVTVNNSSSLMGVQIVDDSSTKDQKLIINPLSPLHNGDIIDWQGSQWLNILTDNMSDIYFRGTLRRCVGSLKWIDSQGQIKSHPFTFKADTATNFGVTDGKVMTLGNERRILIAPLNDDTRTLGKDKRFIFDDRAWRVTAIDRISVDGLMILTVDEVTSNLAVDNFELEIADYFGSVANYTITIKEESSISIQAGKKLQLTTEVKNNGVLTTDIALLYSSSNPNIATVDNNGLVTTIANGAAVITVSLQSDSSISDSINLTVQFETVNNYTVELVETASLYMNQTRTFTAIVKNNGSVVSNGFVNWYLFNDDRVNAASIASIVSSTTTQVTLKGTAVGYVQLKVFIIGVSQPHWIRVQVRSLI
jgi:hypothetical protein